MFNMICGWLVFHYYRVLAISVLIACKTYLQFYNFYNHDLAFNIHNTVIQSSKNIIQTMIISIIHSRYL